MDESPMLIFGGRASPRLTQRICAYLGVKQGRNQTLQFSDGNLFVRVEDNVRGQDVYLVQSTGYPPNDNFMELLFWIDAFKRASAASVTVIIPYFGYAKGDKKDEPRVSIRARVCADAIEAAGADRIVTMDLHAPQIQGFFRKPVDNLYALPILVDRIRTLPLKDPVVVSPDVGFAKPARRFASALSTTLVIADKERTGHDEHASVLNVIGEVEGRDAVIVDDFTASAGTLIEVAQALSRRGARNVCAVVSHGVLGEGAQERLQRSPIQRLIVTDTVEHPAEELSDQVEIVSVAPLFGEAIRRIHHRESISAMFPEPSVSQHD
ncbi:MAG: ribose-phosphate diphosphokinase [Clostridia bacterium]